MLENKEHLPTLREYIDDYLYLRKVKSSKGLISQQKPQDSFKPIIDLQNAIKDHVNIIKKLLISFIEDSIGVSIA